ncbi:hypothetical protein, partial [Flavitalea sp.]|nr:hypothetical protein [Flavitalea sp.]
MSIQNSYLAQSKYGYDTVVAVTQKALNNAIETYYSDSTTFTPVTFYFIKDGSGNAQSIQKADLLKLTNNIDPLSPTVSVAQQKTLSTSQFYFAFSFTIGNPQNYLLTNYLTLKPGSNSVRYSLLCFQLQVAFWNPDNKTWVDIKQTLAKEFNIFADINLVNVLNNKTSNSSVLAAIAALGGTGLNIQQLIFDLDSAVVDPTSTLTGIDSTCSVFTPLMQQFANAYFSTYTSQSGALNYAITSENTASLVPTAMDWFIGPFVDGSGNAISSPTVDQQDLTTLNYVFSVNGDKLPASASHFIIPGFHLPYLHFTRTPFNWNWLEDNGSSHNPDLDTNADVNKYDGAISINRDAFAKYLDNQLKSYVKQNWFIPIVTANYTDLGKKDNADVFQVNTQNIESIPDGFQVYNGDSSSNQSDKLVSWSNQQSVTANGKVNPANYMKVINSFSLDFSVCAGQGTLSQTLEIYVEEVYNDKAYGGLAIFIHSYDVFNLVLDDHGNLMFQKDTDQSTLDNTPHNITLYGEDNGWLQTWLQAVTATSFEELPVSLPQQFVFPGGNAFTFQDAQFANNSD